MMTAKQQAAILGAAGRQDPDARVILFGSRADDHAKSGDIDLLIVSDRIGFHQEGELPRLLTTCKRIMDYGERLLAR